MLSDVIPGGCSAFWDNIKGWEYFMLWFSRSRSKLSVKLSKSLTFDSNVIPDTKYLILAQGISPIARLHTIVLSYVIGSWLSRLRVNFFMKYFTLLP